MATLAESQLDCSESNPSLAHPTFEQMMIVSKQKIQLEKIVAAKDQRIRILKSENQSLSQQLEELRRQHDAVAVKLDESVGKEARIGGIRKALERDFNELRASLTAEQEAHRTLEKQIKALKTDNKQMRQQLEAVEKDKSEYHLKIVKLTQKIEILNQVAGQSDSTIRELRLKLMEEKLIGLVSEQADRDTALKPIASNVTPKMSPTSKNRPKKAAISVDHSIQLRAAKGSVSKENRSASKDANVPVYHWKVGGKADRGRRKYSSSIMDETAPFPRRQRL